MQEQNLFFNILTFDFPAENQTFYFAKDDIGKSHKIHKSLFPNKIDSLVHVISKADGYPFPIKLNIDCTNKEQLKDVKVIRELIDQVYQFSRMYWKSVRQQNLPVTIKYPEMVAQIFPHFVGGKLYDFGKKNLWFL